MTSVLHHTPAYHRRTMGGMIVRPVEAEQPLSLNDSATLVYDLFREPASVEELRREIADEIGEVSWFEPAVRDLRSSGLLTEVPTDRVVAKRHDRPNIRATPTTPQSVVLSVSAADRPLEGAETDIVSWARRGRMTLPLGEVVRRGWIELPDDDMERLSADVDRHAAHQIALEAELCTVATHLQSAGIECRVLKGLATAHLDYPSPDCRQTSDIDILIDPEHIWDAVSALEGIEYENRSVLFRGGTTTLKSLELMSPRRYELDLHWMLARQHTGYWVDRLDPMANGEPYVVGDTDLVALSRELRLIHAVVHWMNGGDSHRRTNGIQDVVAIHGRLAGDASLADHVARARLETAFALALDSVQEMAPDLAQPHEFTVGRRLADLPYARRDPTNGMPQSFLAYLATMQVVGWRDRAAISRALLFPGDAVTRGSWLGRVRDLARRAVRTT